MSYLSGIILLQRKRQRGGVHVNQTERQQQIVDILTQKGTVVTMQSLAEHFNVSIRTIRRDIDELICTLPIQTIRGRYGGGVCFEPWYNPIRTKLSPEQAALLKKMVPTLEGDDLRVLNSILHQFSL